MLTADLVRARRRGDHLHLTRLSGPQRLRALDLAERYLALTRGAIGKSREEYDTLCRAIPAAGPLQKVARGLLKLITDRCEFETASDVDPRALRRAVFLAASDARRDATQAESFDRDAILKAIAAQEGIDPATIEDLLYSDLRAADKLLAFKGTSADKLVADYELAGEQAALLRAQRVVVDVEIASPSTLRRIFHKLKFLRLLFTLEALDAPGRYRITIDGPASLYRASTRYGLQLALALPVLRTCDRFALRADILWGKRRDPLILELEGGTRARGRRSAASSARRSKKAPKDPLTPTPPPTPPSSPHEPEGELPQEIATLLGRFNRRTSKWRAEICTEVLQLPGVGLCVPDLCFTHRDGTSIYLEVLGFWSREAVWRRVELVEAGLPYAIIFAISDRLRVSEAALGDDLPAALLVFKGALQASAVEKKLDALATR